MKKNRTLKDIIVEVLKRKSGDRFNYFHENFNQKISANILLRIAFLCIGVLALMIGIVLLFIPGPGLLFILFGVILICSVSSQLALWMDKIEKKISCYLSRFKK